MTRKIARIQLRRGTSAQWAAADPVLAPGEMGTNTETFESRIGDGVKKWSELPRATDAASNAAQTAADRVQTGLDRVATGENVTLSRAWAESPTPPVGGDSKSSKTWALESAGSATSAAADRVQTGLDRVATGQDVTEAAIQANISTGAAILAGAPIASALPTNDAETAALASPFLFIAPEGIQSWTHTDTFASLTQGPYIPRIEFPTVATLMASTATSLGPTGQIIHAGGFRYEVVTTGEHLTTAGGVKLKVIADSQGIISAAQFNVPFSPSTDGGLLQAALDAAFNSGADLFIPEGHYLTEGLVYKGGDRRSDDPAGPDLRGKPFRVFGAGYGEPFVQTNEFGTCLRSVTNAPVFQDLQGPVPSSTGTLEIEGIRFDGTSSTPVVHLRHFYGLSRIRKFNIYQRGTGDGLKIEYAATTVVENGYALNSDWLAGVGTAGARTGVGFNFDSVRDAGLFRFSGLTSRGFLTGFVLDGSGGFIYKPEIKNCECAFTFNGMLLVGVRGGTVTKNYFEGCDGGVGISLDDTQFTVVSDNFMFPGYATGIDDNQDANFGNEIVSNTVSLGAVASCTGIRIRSTARLKIVHKNNIIAQPGAAGQVGIRIEGSGSPIVSIMDNVFDPSAGFAGAGSAQILNNTGVSLQGFVQGIVAGAQATGLQLGYVTLAQGFTLTEANVSAGKLTLPEGNYFDVSATVATTIQQIEAPNSQGKVVYLRLTNTNATFQSTSQLALGGVNYSGPGILTLMLSKIGSLGFAHEISRAQPPA